MKVIRLQQLMTDGIRQQKSGQFGKKLRRRWEGVVVLGKGRHHKAAPCPGTCAGSQTKPSCLLSPKPPALEPPKSVTAQSKPRHRRR